MSFHNTACFTHTPDPTHAHARTHRHTQGFSSPPHFNLLPVLGVVLFSSSSAEILNRMRVPNSSISDFLFIRTGGVGQSGVSAPGTGSHPRTAALHSPGSLRALQPTVAPLVRAQRCAAPRRACSPAACLQLRCLLSARPATRKAVYGDTQCEKGADLKRRMQARTTKVSYSKVYASPIFHPLA